MNIKLLDGVAPNEDVPHLNLKAGDAGVVIMLYDYLEIELEFIDSEGGTAGLLQLNPAMVRKPEANEVRRHLPLTEEPFMTRPEVSPERKVRQTA